MTEQERHELAQALDKLRRVVKHLIASGSIEVGTYHGRLISDVAETLHEQLGKPELKPID